MVPLQYRRSGRLLGEICSRRFAAAIAGARSTSPRRAAAPAARSPARPPGAILPARLPWPRSAAGSMKSARPGEAGSSPRVPPGRNQAKRRAPVRAGGTRFPGLSRPLRVRTRVAPVHPLHFAQLPKASRPQSRPRDRGPAPHPPRYRPEPADARILLNIAGPRPSRPSSGKAPGARTSNAGRSGSPWNSTRFGDGWAPTPAAGAETPSSRPGRAMRVGLRFISGENWAIGGCRAAKSSSNMHA